MLQLALKFFDQLLGGLFLDAVKGKIENYLDERNVKRTISRASEAPAEALESYFRNEGIEENKMELVLNEVQRAIDSAGIEAKMVASASLNPDKLTEIVLSKYPVPQNIDEEGLDWPFRMALQIAADTVCNVGPRLADWEKEKWRRNFEAFDKLLQNQETIIRAVGPGGEGTLDERFEHTYKSHILRRLAQIDASTLRVSSSLFLDLKTIFVQPDVMEPPKALKEKGDEAGEAKGIASIKEARKQILLAAERHEGRGRTPAEEFVQKHKRCAIVGLPGSGKTTLLQHLLLASASGDIALQSPKPAIPVLVSARQLEPVELPGPEKLLEASAGSVLAGARPGFLQRMFQDNRVLLIVDGLDEVIADKREDVVRWISEFIEVYPNCRYLVSSRPAGYQSEAFNKLDFKEAILCEFSPDQMREYVHRWAKAVEISEGACLDEAEKKSSECAGVLAERAERNPYVRRIATNPLMLSTLCLVQRYEGGDLPNRRTVLYQRCVEGLLFHWDNKRGLPPALLGALPLERRMMLVRRLALQMQVQGVAEVDASMVERVFADSLKEVGEPAEAGVILDNIRDRSGLLVERRPGVYGFSHLTFQEYLAALAVNEADYRQYDRLFLFSRRKDPQWSEAIPLYAGIASRDSVERLLKELLRTNDPYCVVLAGECLAGAREVELNMQKQVISAVLRQDLDLHLLPRVPGLLRSLDEVLVVDQVVASLDRLKAINIVGFMSELRNPKSVIPLLAAGTERIKGTRRPDNVDWLLTFALSGIEHSLAAKALAELTEAALAEPSSHGIGTVLRGIWFRFWLFEWTWSRAERGTGFLPGVLKFLDHPPAVEEQINLAKHLEFVSSAQGLKHLDEEKIFPGLISSPIGTVSTSVLKLVSKKLQYLLEQGAPSVRDCAGRAAANFAKIIATAEKRPPTTPSQND